jgi:uncharacterized repeat protein (TIGR03803 family)
MKKRFPLGAIFAALISSLAAASSLFASDVFQPIAGFSTPGRLPEGGLVSDGAGNLWGTTVGGGGGNEGSIFKVNIASGVLTTVTGFSSTPPQTDGYPLGTLVSDGAGNFWGVTLSGGINNTGSVFKVGLASGAITTVVSFDNASVNPTDNTRGQYPLAGLVSDGAGYLWGTTSAGGKFTSSYDSATCGTIYKIKVSTGAITTVADFDATTSTTDNVRGETPSAGLVSDGAGNLWGTTSTGGVNHRGTVFKVNVSTGVVTTVVDFDQIGNNFVNANGAFPMADLVSDGAGNLWGTTQYGGPSGAGVVFKINISTGVMTTVGTFDDSTSTSDNKRGGGPIAGLVSDGLGNLWGTTSAGGAFSFGTVFKVKISTGAITTAVDFDDSVSMTDQRRGDYPQADLVSDGLGNLWGTTKLGGVGDSGGHGTVFKINPNTNAITTVADVGASGPVALQAGLVSDGAGNVWGTSADGGAQDQGAVFKMNVATGAVTTVVDFDNTTSPADNVRGSLPSAALVTDGTGNFWGTTLNGGTSGWGTLFRVNISTGAITTIDDFDHSTSSTDNKRGGNPSAALVSDGAGSLWGTAQTGGTNSQGVVYKVNTSTGAMTTVIDFDGSTTQGDNQRGGSPDGGLVNDGAGNFWGTTSGGGAGTIFKVNATSGAITTLVDFAQSTSSSNNERGARPEAEMVSDGAGNLWGTTAGGGTGGQGTVYKINVSTGLITTIADFDGNIDNSPGDNYRGGEPEAGLASDGEGNLWGTTTSGGFSQNGTVFEVNMTSGSTTTLFDFTGNSGAVPGMAPRGTLLFTGTGFYGTTTVGGESTGGSPAGEGEIFFVGLPLPPVAGNVSAEYHGGGSIVINVLASDSDPGGGTLDITKVTKPEFGTVTITGSGTTITYTPKLSTATYSGSDTFTYTITDSLGATGTGTIVVTNPYYSQSGNFAGLLKNPGGGYLTLTTSVTGAFTGKLKIGKTTYSFTGVFGTNGAWTGIVGGEQLVLQFNLGDVAVDFSEQYSIAGTYNGVFFAAYHAIYSSATPAPEVGTYKVLINPPAQTGTTQATATALVTNGVITGISITGSGLGYVSLPAVTISATSGKGAVLTASVLNGQVTGIKLVKGGSKYPATGVIVNIAPPSGNPIGIGYGTLTVAKLGTATLTGKLADGTAFTDALLITGGTGSADTVQVYVNLPYHVAGSLVGTLTFENEPGVSDLDATLAWTKPLQIGSAVALFQGGFSLDTTAIGSLSVAPKGAPALALATTSPNATVALDEPNWSAPIVKNITVATNNKATVNNPGTDKLALTISAPGGAISGSFIDPVTGKHQAFTGVLFQKQTAAGGYFVNTTESGSVSLSPITISASIK